MGYCLHHEDGFSESKQKITRWGGGAEKPDPPAPLVRMQVGAATVVTLPKIKQGITVSSNSASQSTLKIRENRYLDRYGHARTHSSVIHISQEITRVSVSRWMAKQNVVKMYNRISFILKKEGGPDTCHDTDEP